MLIQEERTHHRDTGPVGRERNQTNDRDRHKLRPIGKPFAAEDRDQHDRPCQRPHHAGLVEKAAVRKGKERNPEREGIRKVRDDRKEKQPAGIFPNIARIVTALRDEKPHDRRGQPADDMQRKDIPDRLCPREDRPRQVVDRHGDDRDQLELITVKPFFCRCHLICPFRRAIRR